MELDAGHSGTTETDAKSWLKKIIPVRPAANSANAGIAHISIRTTVDSASFLLSSRAALSCLSRFNLMFLLRPVSSCSSLLVCGIFVRAATLHALHITAHTLTTLTCTSCRATEEAERPTRCSPAILHSRTTPPKSPTPPSASPPAPHCTGLRSRRTEDESHLRATSFFFPTTSCSISKALCTRSVSATSTDKTHTPVPIRRDADYSGRGHLFPVRPTRARVVAWPRRSETLATRWRQACGPACFVFFLTQSCCSPLRHECTAGAGNTVLPVVPLAVVVLTSWKTGSQCLSSFARSTASATGAVWTTPRTR